MPEVLSLNVCLSRLVPNTVCRMMRSSNKVILFSKFHMLPAAQQNKVSKEAETVKTEKNENRKRKTKMLRRNFFQNLVLCSNLPDSITGTKILGTSERNPIIFLINTLREEPIYHKPDFFSFCQFFNLCLVPGPQCRTDLLILL